MIRSHSVWAFASALILAFGASAAGGSLRVSGLRCEYRTDPIGVDVARPRLNWVLDSARRGERQSAYQVLVASSEQSLAAGRGDLWDSGRVSSSDSIQVESAASPWSRINAVGESARLDADGKVSAWSAPATGHGDDGAGGLEGALDFPRGSQHPETPAPLFRKEFRIAKPICRAVAYVSGLGFQETRLNGYRIGDRALEPAWTDYRQRIFYSTDDVTALLRPGVNAIAAMLGNGMYNVIGGRYVKFKASFGAPALILQIHVEYADGTADEIVSDGSWKTALDPWFSTASSAGRSYDARREAKGWDRPGFDDSRWEPATVAAGPGGRLIAASAPP
jgi:alpha-L-rhamnosidase